MKFTLSLAISASLCLCASSAFAQPPSLISNLKARPAAEVSVGFHVPMGGSTKTPSKATYGASFGYRAGGGPLDESTSAPFASLAEFSFSGGKVEQARVASVDFANTGSDIDTRNSEGFSIGGLSQGWSTVVVLVGVGLALNVYFANRAPCDQETHYANTGSLCPGAG